MRARRLLTVGMNRSGKTIEFLEKHPFIGRERRDLKHHGIRSWRVKDFERWLIFYGVSPTFDAGRCFQKNFRARPSDFLAR